MKKRYIVMAAMLLSSTAMAQPMSRTMGQDITESQAAAEISAVYRHLSHIQKLAGQEQQKTRQENFRASKTRHEALHNPLPFDMAVSDVRITGERILVRLEGSFGRLDDLKTKDGLWLAEYQYQILYNHFAELHIGGSIAFEVRDEETGQFRPLMPSEEEVLGGVEEPEEVPVFRPSDTSRAVKLPLGGALVGKRVALSAGHGWDDGWERPLCNFDKRADGVREDITNAIFINRWVIPLLQNMGAEVISVREPDFSQDYKIVDNGDAGYSETGTFQDSTSNSSDGTRFRHGSTYRFSEEAGAKATWSHTFPASGYRRIQVWYPESSNRPNDVKYTVKAGGGTFEYTINQTQYGRRYVDLGLHWCAANVPCSVTVERVASSGALIADAVKFSSFTLSSSPNLPLWQMGGQYYINDYTLGKANAIHTSGITTRPRFAKLAGADVYISIHTNAYQGCETSAGSSARGYVTYNYEGGGVSGMSKFGNMIHKGVIGHIHRDYDSGFYDRGLKSEAFAELKGGMPSVLLELAFHDNIKPNSSQKQSDNEAIQDPRFKQAVAMGIADGIVQYFTKNSASEYKMGDGLPPARPTQIKAQNTGQSCELTVSWAAVPGAEEYLLYQIDNLRPGFERAWDSGTRINGTSTVLKDLEPGRAYAFKVAAVSKNGISYPSPAVTARLKGVSHQNKGLYINGYTRWDAIVNYHVDNDLDYAAEHGIALAAAGDTVYFDGITVDAAADTALDGYAFVDFQAGQNDDKYRIMPEAFQNALETYIQNGGKLLISGTDLAKVLNTQGKSLLNNTLKVNYSADDAGVYTAKGSGKFSSLTSLTFDDGKHGIYPASYADVLTNAGAETILTYDGSKIAAAATDNTIAMGFPVETIYPAKSRAQFMGCAIHHLLSGAPCVPEQYDTPADGAPIGQCAQCDSSFTPVCEDAQTIKSCQNELFVMTACPEHQQCTDGACTDLPECTGDEKRCSSDKTALEICTDGKFVIQLCPENQHCHENVCVPNETPETPAACAETDAPKCNDSHTGVLTCVDGEWQETSCAPETCSKGQCVIHTPGNPNTHLPTISIVSTDNGCSMTSSRTHHPRPLAMLAAVLGALSLGWLRRRRIHHE